MRGIPYVMQIYGALWLIKDMDVPHLTTSFLSYVGISDMRYILNFLTKM